MAEAITGIKVGSIINLQNGAPNGGYLDTRGWVSEKPVITKFQDPHIVAFVSTHARANRAPGSGSWQLLSADGKSDGEPINVGDKIYLLNKQVGTGYLDSFEWVGNLAPFATYPLTIGVFTADVPDRGGGVSGTWTIESAAHKQIGDPIVEGDAIYLRNDYPDAGVLQTYAHVTAHPMFADYDGQSFFVFTGPLADGSNADADPERGSAQWMLTLSNDSATYQVQIQWGDASAPWHSGGVFKIGDPRDALFDTLTLTSTDQGATLIGQLQYWNEAGRVKVTAHRRQANIYAVSLARDGSSADAPSEQEWVLGSPDLQNLTSLDITWETRDQNDRGNTFRGTLTLLTYEGEVQIEVSGQRAEIVIDEISEVLRGRTRRLDGVIDATYTLLSSSFHSISGHSLNDLLTRAKQSSVDKAALDAQQIRRVLGATLGHGSGSSGAVDRIFQLEQILSLRALSEKLNGFLQKDLRDLIERSLRQHRRDKTPAPLSLFRECFRHVAADHEIIQQATIQRQWNQYKNGSSYMSEQALELLVIDKLAFKAVEPFKHLLAGITDRISVISYLSEKTHIDRLPYTDRIILIGVSYDRVPLATSLDGSIALRGSNYSSAFELMAIPHEVGHYIYRYGRLSDGRTFSDISKRFAGSNPYYAWCEEIFADVYGCIVAGPLSALGMQALLASINKERAWKDDEEHPTPVLRVFILTEILRVLHELEKRSAAQQDQEKKTQVEELTRKLDQDWLAIVEGWGYQRLGQDSAPAGRPARIYSHDLSDPQHDTIVNIDRVMLAIQPIIIAFASHLLEQATKAGAVQTGSEQAGASLDLTIPWNASYDVNVGTYNDAIAKLTSRDFAHKQVPAHIFSDDDDPSQTSKRPNDSASPDEWLQRYLDGWGDRGPMGSGGGTYFL